MKRARINLTLTESVKKAREELIVSMKRNPQVRDFLAANDLDESLVEDYPQMFADWLNELKECEGCQGLNACVKENHGRFFDLYYDNFLQKQLVSCAFAVEEDKKRKYLDYYIQRDFPDDISTVTINKLNLDKEPNHYIQIIGTLVDWLDEPSEKGFYLYGDVGVGKTFLSAVVSNELALKQKTVAFVHLPTFATRMRGLVTDNQEFRRVLNQTMRCDLLVLDDIGAETVTDWFRDDVLLSILNYRMESKLPVFYTSNLDLDELEAHFAYNNRNEYNALAAKRVMERIEVTSHALHLKGENRRNALK